MVLLLEVLGSGTLLSQVDGSRTSALRRFARSSVRVRPTEEPRSGQRPNSFLAAFTSAWATSTVPLFWRCFLRLPVVGADANAAPDFRPVWSRRSLPEPVTLNRFLAPECVLFFGIVPLPYCSYCVLLGKSCGRGARPRSCSQPECDANSP